MAKADREIVENVLSPDLVEEVWTGSYDKVLPMTLLDFELSAVLPAVFYMFRYGHRRGAGKFLATYGPQTGTSAQKRRQTTVDRVAAKLRETDELAGFDGEVEQAILGDLLLCFCLENVRHKLGRDEQVQRVAPTHYLASWIDLPQSVAHLRFVPEMIVAMLANRREGDYVTRSEATDPATHFSVGNWHEDNVLLRAFSQGLTHRGDVLADQASDRFDDTNEAVGLDQLLTIRLALQLAAAPSKLKAPRQGTDAHRISNQRPIAEAAGRRFSDDIRRFVRSYARPAPRHVFVDMLESCIAIGLTTIVTSTVEVLSRWAATGGVPDRDTQHPAALFVDCSSSADQRLRLRAEQSTDDLMRRLERVPVILMALRLLDYEARSRPRIKLQQVATRPYATEWLNLLGDLAHDRHPEAQRVAFAIEDKAERLAEKVAEDHDDVARTLLGDADDQRHAVWRLAAGLMALKGANDFQKNFIGMVDSMLAVGRPNGLAVKRTTTRGSGAGPRRGRDVRALVFTDAVLDYLVHLHLLPGPKGGPDANIVSLLDFLREDYGFHVDTAPPGMTISNEVLGRNRAALERRLRDLGLLIGVNDAERMKRLTPRFETAGGM